MKNCLILCVFLLCGCVANDNVNTVGYRQVVSSTVKYLARAFVAQTDIEDLKQRNILRIEKNSDAKFKERYAKAYVILNKLPQSLLDKYSIREQVSKEEVIARIRVLTKDDLLNIVDAIPDDFIVNSLEQYVKNKKDILGSNMVGSLHRIWGFITRKA